MRIGIVSQFYAPEPGPATLPATLAEELASRGHSVRVVTGFPNYPTGRVAKGYRLERCMDEVRNNVSIRRVFLHPDHGSAAGRAANYGSFGVSAIVNGLNTLRGADAVWVNASPITLAWPIAALRAMRLPVVSHILDLWPESLFATGFGGWAENPAATRFLHSWTNSMYRMSQRIAYISPGVREVLIGRGVPADKLRYVPMWADESTFHPGGHSMRRELGVAQDAIVVAYAGALGEAQGLNTLIDACRRVQDPRLVCLIAGSGGSEHSLRAAAEGVRNVRFLGRLPQERMTDFMASIDASYVSLRDTPLGLVSTPSKTQAALASGVPLVVAANGDVRDIVDEVGAGLPTNPSDAGAVARSLRQLCSLSIDDRARMSSRARTAYLGRFSLTHAADQVETLLREVSCSHRKEREA